MMRADYMRGTHQGMLHVLLVAFLMVFSLTCGGTTVKTNPEPGPVQLYGPSPLAAEAIAGVDAPALQTLLAKHWEQTMEASPVWAGTIGDNRFMDRLADTSEAARMARREKRHSLLAQARALDATEFSARDQVTLALFTEGLHRDVGSEQCESFRWSVSARANPVSSANSLPEDHKITDMESARNLVLRYKQIADSVDVSIANLRSGLAQGRVANAESIRRTVLLVEGQLEKDLDMWALLKPVAVIDSMADGEALERAKIGEQLRGIVEDDIKPAFERYLAFLRDELVPAGRTGDQIGVHALPAGLACYEASIAGHINLDKSADEIHRLGLAELQRINAEMAALGASLFGTNDLASTISHLRTSNDLYFETAGQIEAKAVSSLARAKLVIPVFFGILPKADCVVTPIPDYEAPYTTIAYYKQPHANGAKPGEYFINTYKPETRPRFEMEVLAYHESIPGHHLQIAIGLERGDLPLFRRHGGSTAFVEGWALYTERLADEMGLYSGDLDRMGMLSYDAWRASRLVVDTGIHAKRWTRAQAEAFMQEHTALTKGNITNEVDRYISWPGQAVAYKIGQLEIFRLRRMAKEKLGDNFDIRGFHDVVLSQGAVTLPVLAAQVEAWLETVASAKETCRTVKTRSGRLTGSEIAEDFCETHMSENEKQCVLAAKNRGQLTSCFEQSYSEGIKIICDVPKQIELSEDPAEAQKQRNDYISGLLRNPKAIELLRLMGISSLDERRQDLDEAARAVGLRACALSEYFARQASDSKHRR